MQILKYGMNYSIERSASTYTPNLVAEAEQAIRLLDVKLQNSYRFMATKEFYLSRYTGQSPAESDDTRGCIYTVTT
jgi:hypothetical protein